MSDNLFVNRDSTTYQVNIEKIRTIEDTDLLLVNRNGTTYRITKDKINTIEDTDLLLVNRNGTIYRVTGDRVDRVTGSIEEPVIVLTPLDGTGLNTKGTYEPLSTAITAVAGTSLTFTDDTELANMVGPLAQVDENGDVKTPVTSTIVNTSAAANPVLTFASPNPDLQYFKPGDQVGVASGFKTVLFNGNGSNKTVTGVGFRPSLVWAKNRNGDVFHEVWDVVRGVNSVFFINEDRPADGSNNRLSSFDADGFTLKSGSISNSNGASSVAWCWYGGETNVTNNEGSIQSTVRSSGNFSVVNYTGNGSGGTVGHGLNSAPKFMVVKNIGSNTSFFVYHEALGNSLFLKLDNQAGQTGSSGAWNNQTPNASTFSVGNAGETNGNNSGMIAWCWAEVPKGSSFGSYSGNGSTNGPVIDCGFRPEYVLIKRANGTAFWDCFDSARDPSNPRIHDMWVDISDPEFVSTAYSVDFLDNGFQLRNTQDKMNVNGGTYVYAAFANDNPIEVANVDVAANTMTVNGGTPDGSVITGPTLTASASSVVSLNGNTLSLSGVSGDWREGLHAQGAEITDNPPSPSSIVFTSSNGGTTAFTGTDATLTSRTWTLESGDSSTGPWTVVGEYEDTSANASQDGSVNWTNHPALETNKYYKVKVKYNSDNTDPVESTFNTFKTGPS